MGQIVEDKFGQQWVESEDGTRNRVIDYIGETRIGYLCATDFVHELGEHAIKPDGSPSAIQVYGTEDEAKRARGCISEQCGYVKVLMVLLELGK